MSPNQATVSVIMPLYNGEIYVEKALRSVITQTLQPIELIVIDDGSADSSAEVVASTTAPFPIRILHQENAGQSAARNAGLNIASGDYVAFIDQDDEWVERHVEVLLKAITKTPGLAWAYSDFDEIDGEGRAVTHGFIRESGQMHPKRTLAACLSSDLMIIPSASLLQRQALIDVGGFDEELSGYEDDELFVRMFRAGWRHVYVPKPLTRFRIHNTSSSTSDRFLESRLAYLHKLALTVIDDRRSNRYWVRDLVLPRFFDSTLHDYARALSHSDWPQASRVAVAARHIAGFMHPRLRRRIELRLLEHPRLFRPFLRLAPYMPKRIRKLIPPSLTLQRMTRYATIPGHS